MRLLRLWLPVVLWAALILIASGNQLSEKRTRTWFRSVTGGGVPHWVHHTIRKSGHVFEYAILGALAIRASSATWDRRRTAVMVAMLVSLSVAGADELRQSFMSDRRGAPDDVVLDTSSAALVIALIAHRQKKP